MKKKLAAVILAGCMIMTTACTKEVQQTPASTVEAEEIFSEAEASQEQTQTQETETQQTQAQQTEEQTSTTETENTTEAQSPSYEHPNEAAGLTEGEKEARKQQQANFAEARELLFSLPNSKDKTTKINQMDRQILANNPYNFAGTNIVFIGDSITEGVTAAVDQNGNRVSYVTYVNSYLHFANVLNHGKGGRMFGNYGGEDYSLNDDFGNVTNVNSDIIVVFAGVNDYLSASAGKRFGNADDKLSTAGYCGAVRAFMNQLQRYYSDKQIFFVMMYNVGKTSNATYSDITTQPTLNDYLDVQRKIAKEFGFHIIDLYKQGFMDCSTQESSDYYLHDGLHPNDNGNIVLGEHIAAELSLYFGQK